jgi:hypothetical protein
VFAVASVAIGLLGSASAWADDQATEPCTEAAEVCGKRAFEQGIAAYQAGEYVRALGLFRQAQASRPHPSILFNVALAEAKNGQLAEALGHLEEVFADPGTPADLLPTVREERDRVRGQVATVSVGSDTAELYVDGVLAQGHPPERRVNPGRHQMKVVVRGKTVVDRPAVLASGQHMEVAFAEPSPEPPAPAAAEPPRAGPSPISSVPTPLEHRGLSPWWVVVGTGVTAVLGGVTLYSYLDTRRAFDQFKRDLPDLTQAEAQRRVDQGHDMQARTNWLLAGTLVAGAATAGVALFLAEWSRGKPGLVLRVGAGGAAVAGRF